MLVALDLLGATPLIGAVLGLAGMVGLVLGFAFKDLAENYVAVVLLGLRQPFSPGDTVRIHEHEGQVVPERGPAQRLQGLARRRLFARGTSPAGAPGARRS